MHDADQIVATQGILAIATDGHVQQDRLKGKQHVQLQRPHCAILRVYVLCSGVPNDWIPAHCNTLLS